MLRKEVAKISIQHFKCRGTEDIFRGNNSKKARKILPRELVVSGRQTLATLDSAQSIQDLKKIPGNHYEELTNKGKESIRINKQYRVLFNWTDSGPAEVEISKHYE